MSNSTARRVRYLAQSGVLMLAVSAVCVFGVLLASRHPYRLDATATREHRLSDRTRTVLQSLKAPHEIVLVTNASQCDPVGLERTLDVLDKLSRESRWVSATFIDADSGRGIQQLDDVFARLIDRYRPTIDRADAAIRAAAETATALAVKSSELATGMQTAADGVPSGVANAAELKRFFADSAAVLRLAGTELDTASGKSVESASATARGVDVPLQKQAVRVLRAPVASLIAQIEEIDTGLEALSQAKPDVIPESVRNAARELRSQATPLRDEIARLSIALDAVPLTPLEDCLNTLSRGPAALIIGPPSGTSGTAPAGASPESAPIPSIRGVTAVDVQSLLLPAAGDDPTRGRLDLRFRVEELLVGGLAVLNARDAPIVCFVHAESEKQVLAPAYAPLAALVQRLGLRGIEVLEWPVIGDDEPPSLSGIPGGDRRHVVYVVIPTSAFTPDGALRMKRLADQTARLIEQGKPVLLSLTPSTLPGIGQTDPMVEFLEPLGLKPDTGRPLLQANPVEGSSQTAVVPDLVLTRADPSSPIGVAIQSLKTHLRWAVPLRIDSLAQSKAKTQIRTVLAVPAEESTWAESEWLGFWQLASQDRYRVTNPPTPNQVRDDTNGPWPVVVTLEREDSPGSPAAPLGRVVVAGANGWFFDQFTQAADAVDARAVPRAPGNTELFEASIYWLAGQEPLIARSAESQSAPTIPGDLSDRSLTLMRWALILGLPVAVLLLGLLWRLLRG